MTVPFLDLQAAYSELSEELDAAALRVLKSGWYVGGVECAAFEQEFAAYCGVSHCVGVGNGLDALALILRGYGVGAGDEVIVPAQTFIATWLAVSAVGATPVPVAVNPRTSNIDPQAVEQAISDKTRAVIAVHLYGCPAEMSALKTMTAARGIKLIEDAAQAHGARLKGLRTGALGNAAAFSFYPGKNLGAYGDGGAVVTNDAQLAENVRMLGNYGSKKKYEHECAGTNSRLDPVQAAMLRVKLAHLDAWNARRVRVAERYLEAFQDLSGVDLPVVGDEMQSAWHLFVVQTDRRDALQSFLSESGVQTLIHYPVAPHRTGAYSATFSKESDPLKAAQQLADRVLSLPMGPHLTDEQQDDVIQAVSRFGVEI